ncbi:hypothetical protein [Halomonas sp. E19]|uniref:hypothetical protein n=1 Tax=Halomonas sp. E19 TaxID=3397247 RepID=UPI00403446E0
MPDITFITNGGKVISVPEDSNLLRMSLREKGAFHSSAAAACVAPASVWSRKAWRTPTP